MIWYVQFFEVKPVAKFENLAWKVHPSRFIIRQAVVTLPERVHGIECVIFCRGSIKMSYFIRASNMHYFLNDTAVSLQSA